MSFSDEARAELIAALAHAVAPSRRSALDVFGRFARAERKPSAQELLDVRDHISRSRVEVERLKQLLASVTSGRRRGRVDAGRSPLLAFAAKQGCQRSRNREGRHPSWTGVSIRLSD